MFGIPLGFPLKPPNWDTPKSDRSNLHSNSWCPDFPAFPSKAFLRQVRRVPLEQLLLRTFAAGRGGGGLKPNSSKEGMCLDSVRLSLQAGFQDDVESDFGGYGACIPLIQGTYTRRPFKTHA